MRIAPVLFRCRKCGSTKESKEWTEDCDNCGAQMAQTANAWIRM